MPESDDHQLLAAFARTDSEPAFAALVGRYVNLVYSTALRSTGNPHYAEEITQAVFIILARKAGRLSPRIVLSGWLYQTARLTSANLVKSEIRRRRREQEVYMQSALNEPTEATWKEIAPLLEDAMGRLGKTDRDALVLRFFENKSAVEIGAAMQMNEETARRRVNRALEKLRKFFAKRGVASSAAAIAENISANSIQTAPVALAKSVTGAALAKGAAASTSTLTLIKGTLKAMTWVKVKWGCGFGAAMLLVGSVVTFAITGPSKPNLANTNTRYQIEGDLVSADHVRNFTLAVDGRNWAIHLTNPKPETNQINWAAFGMGPQKAGPSIKYQDVTCLNGVVYKYTYFGEPPAGSQAKNSGTAVIQLGESATEDGTFANVIWVGLASGGYFSGVTNHEVTPMTAMPDASEERVKAQWQLNNAAPFLPKWINYRQNPISGIILRPGVILHQFDKGWRSGEVRVLKQTNINGEIFPTIYTYEQFGPKLNSGASPYGIARQFRVTVNVHSIRLHSVPEVLPPKTAGQTLVSDHRISKQAIYFMHGGRLPEKPDVKAAKQFRQKVLSHLKVVGRH